jgi:hypothetical protein
MAENIPIAKKNILAFAQMDYRKTMSLHQDGSHQ